MGDASTVTGREANVPIGARTSFAKAEALFEEMTAKAEAVSASSAELIHGVPDMPLPSPARD